MIKQFIVALVSYMVLDAVWLGFITKKFYAAELGGLSKGFNFLPGLGAYLLIAIGMAVFVAPKITDLQSAAIYGALYGLIAYGIYDLTNMAIITDWSIKLSAADVGWGVIASAIAATAIKILTL